MCPRINMAILVSLLVAAIPTRGEREATGFRLLPANGSATNLRVIDAGRRRWVHYQVRLFRWLPERPAGASIVYNHGLQSHSAWFFATAEALRQRGYAVYAFDRIGSGQSNAGVGRDHRDRRFNSAGHISDWRLFVNTLSEVIGQVRRERGGDSVILWGNSYGAKVVSAWLHEHEQAVAAAIFTTPGLYHNERSMPLPFSKLRLLLSAGRTKFPLPMVERGGDNGAAWFIGPGPWFDAIRADHLSLREVTRDFYLQTARMDRYLARHRRQAYTTPAFFLLVRNDVMMDNQKMLADIRDRSLDAHYKYYQGGDLNKHFLMFTEDRDEALDDIVKFISGRRRAIAGLDTP